MLFDESGHAAEADGVTGLRWVRTRDAARRHPRSPREAIPPVLRSSRDRICVSDHPASGAGFGFVTERSSGGGAPGSSSWANARATLTARSLARWPEPIVSKHAVRLLDYSALANGDSCRRLLSPESSSLDAARRQTYARSQMRKPASRFSLWRKDQRPG